MKSMEILVARTNDETELAIGRLRRAAVLGCDTETSGLSPTSGRILSVQFSDGDLSVLVPMSEGIGIGGFAELLSEPSIVKVFHNARFDLSFLRRHVKVENYFCTMIAEKILTRGANQSVSLAETLYRHFAVDLDKAPRQKFTKNWDGIWTDELVAYALGDVIHLPGLMSEQIRWLERIGLTDEYRDQLEKLLP